MVMFVTHINGKCHQNLGTRAQECLVARMKQLFHACQRTLDNALKLVLPVDFSATAHHIQLLDKMECGYFNNIKLFHNVLFRANDLQQ